MRWRRFRALIPFLLLALLAVTPISASAQTKQDVDRADDAVEYAEAKESQAFQNWLAAREALEAAVTRYEEVNAEREALTYTVGQLFDRIREYESEVGDLRDRARELVMEAYTSASTGLIGAAFESASIQDLLTSQVLIDKATNQDVAQLDQFEAVKRDMERLKTELGTQETRVKALEDEAILLVGQMDELDAQAEAAYGQASANVKTAIDKLKREQAEFEAAEARRKAQAAAAARQRASGTAAGLPPEATPGFICPVSGSPSFINSWGFPRSGGRTHKGVDMFDPSGTLLVAVTSGSVKLRTVNLGGIVTYLYGDDGNLYYYAHLNGYPAGLQNGQRVNGGDPVGYVGNSGNARYTSPHLHFEIRPGYASAVNPYPTVRYYC